LCTFIDLILFRQRVCIGKDNFPVEHNKEVISTFVMPTIVLHLAHFAPALNVKWGLACGFILYY